MAPARSAGAPADEPAARRRRNGRAAGPPAPPDSPVALRQELELNAAILDTAGALVVVLDPAGRIVRFNRACEQATGWRFAEVRGRRLWDALLLPQETRAVQAVFAALRAGQFPNTHENHWVTRDGRTRLITWSNTALLGAGGEVRYVIGTGIDVTEQRQAERARRRSESRLRSILDTVVDGIITVDEAGTIQSFNPAAERIFGYAPEEVIGRSVALLIAPGLAPSQPRSVCARCAAAAPRPGPPPVVTGRRRDGSTFPMELAVGAADPGEGRLFTGIVRDITERVRAEEALRRAHDELEQRVTQRTEALRSANARLQREVQERRQAEQALRASEERFRLLCAAAPIGIFEVDAAGQCRYANARLHDICGSRSEDLARLRWLRRVHPHGRATLRRQMRAARRTGQGLAAELRVVCPDQTVRWVQLRTTPLRDPDGRPAGLVGTVEDVTERRRAEDEIRQREVQLAHVSRLHTIGEMAAMLAHELNQPLTAISNYAQGALRRLAGRGAPEELRDALAQVSAEAGRAAQIIAALRRFLRRHEPAAAPTDLNEVAQEAARLLEPDARHRAVELRLALAGDLPAVQVDRVHITQVLVNLMRNGLEAMDEAHPVRRRLTVRTSRSGPEAVELAVEDYGPGLDEAALERIFEPFYTTKPHGMGMGLAICRSIVQAHGGRLWGAGRPGGGASFHMRLPILARSTRG